MIKIEAEYLKQENFKTEEPEFFTLEFPIDENELRDTKLQVAVIKEEPIDAENFIEPEYSSSSENDNENSTGDEFPLIFSIKNQKIKTDDKTYP